LKNFYLLLLICSTIHLSAQENKCNKLGVWLWYLEITDYKSHEALADKLKSLDIKRVYVKVADGRVNATTWPEITDKAVVKAYKDKGLEVWAWSYNYPGNNSLQAEALYLAAKTGYEGFVVDVETEFDNKATETRKLFTAFDKAKKKAIKDGWAATDFKLYVTTWGNPKDHNCKINEIDAFVDGYMPQTYVENWGQTYINNIPKWIVEGNKEYKLLGATKPIHHIISTEKAILSSAQINQFIENSGGESSIWRIPGGGVPASIWDNWQNVNWKKDFCTTSSSFDLKNQISIFPNPVYDNLTIENYHGRYAIIDQCGATISESNYDGSINLTSLEKGLYFLRLGDGVTTRFVKN
jgi:hypothetical protein